ncbi:hypothetical protein PhCBS80983_g05883 [Powellomyces hirtus]|uniref:LysM domain-containing protein n=1 Tax=Powellomyces hirtus TaxID=109895 RepID=A0A507DS50_9FUNG|nr:hypothetical protein PhCBS80983_g05883 [Powellomyces hirtus]
MDSTTQHSPCGAIPPPYTLLPAAGTSQSSSDLPPPPSELPGYDGHGFQSASTDEQGGNEKPGDDKPKMVTHYVTVTDTLPGLSLKYDVPLDAIRRANSLFFDDIFARSMLLIPFAPKSLSPTADPGDEEKRLVKRFQIVSKCTDSDEAWSYMRQNEFHIEAALEQYWADIKWEKENAAHGTAAKVKGDEFGKGKWKVGMGMKQDRK